MTQITHPAANLDGTILAGSCCATEVSFEATTPGRMALVMNHDPDCPISTPTPTFSGSPHGYGPRIQPGAGSAGCL